MLATVVAELATPALVARLGYRVVLGAGLVLLGAPALGLIGTRSLGIILAVSVVRGVGLAILVVAGSALVATLVPRERRSEGIGLSGLVVGVPAVLALPLGVWLSGRIGFSAVFVAAGVAGLVPGRPVGPAGPPSGGDAVGGDAHGSCSAGPLPPALLFLLTALGAGIVVTFLPLATGGAGGGTAPVALLVNAVATTAARWWSRRQGDRHGRRDCSSSASSPAPWAWRSSRSAPGPRPSWRRDPAGPRLRCRSEREPHPHVRAGAGVRLRHGERPWNLVDAGWAGGSDLPGARRADRLFRRLPDGRAAARAGACAVWRDRAWWPRARPRASSTSPGKDPGAREASIENAA